MTAKIGVAIAVAALACAACALEETKPAPQQLPAAFEQQAPDGPSQWPETDWFRGFASDELNRLIALAGSDSLDIGVAMARIRQADAQARAAGAAILPQLDAGANITQFGGRSRGVTAHETDWSVPLSASYEVDFWGRNRAARDSAQALARASRAEFDTVKITVLSGVANTYFQLLSLRERIALAQLNLAAARDLLQFTETRYEAGAASPAELAAQRAAVANSQLIIPQLQQQEIEARGALAVLVGQAPEGFTVSAQGLQSLAEPVASAGLPSELLQRRPDVAAAENNLRAANADLAVARAALFPSLSLTAGGAIQNPAVQAAVLTLEGTGYSVTAGAALLQALFDGGRRRAQIAEAAARRQELIASYRRGIINAFLDVETALAAVQHLQLQQQPQQENLAQSERAFDGAQLRYREGAAEYLAVLESQHTLYAAREQFSQYRLARLQAAVALGKALGGGWQDPGSSLPSSNSVTRNGKNP